MRIEADPEVCMSSGTCALSAPDLFDQSDEDGTVVLLSADVPDDRLDAVRTVVRRCPSGALQLVD